VLIKFKSIENSTIKKAEKFMTQNANAKKTESAFKMKNREALVILIAILTTIFFSFSTHAARLKDMADIKGIRSNQLLGYGLVVGLDGTGDGKKSLFTNQSTVSLLEKMGVSIKEKDIDVKNVAAVMVTANLPPFAKTGNKIDVMVSSIGDATNLQGGTLLFTPMRAADGNVYVVAQGPVSTGGFSAKGEGGSVTKNFPTVGRVVDGGSIENELKMDFNNKEELSLFLHNPDFTTASRITEAINGVARETVAHSSDPGTIGLRVPERYRGNVVAFVTLIEGIEITPDNTSKVVINERTGTVVMGENVRLATVAIAHGNLSIEIKENTQVSQPLPFSKGKTVESPDTNISVTEENVPIYLLNAGASISDVIKALNALGVTPRDLIAIMQALKASGALQAKLEIM
jgi:flagellar P-ring protein precursor FlgI